MIISLPYYTKQANILVNKKPFDYFQVKIIFQKQFLKILRNHARLTVTKGKRLRGFPVLVT